MTHQTGAPLDAFGAEITGCTAGPESLLHQAEFGSMREEERGGEGGGSLHKSRLRFSVVAQYVAGCQLDHIAQNGRGVMQQIQPLLASFGNRPVGFNSFNPSFIRACCARQITFNAYHRAAATSAASQKAVSSAVGRVLLTILED